MKKARDTRMLNRLHTIRKKYPDTWKVVCRLALRAGRPIGMILTRFNFSELMMAEDERRMPLFRRLREKYLRFVSQRKELYRDPIHAKQLDRTALKGGEAMRKAI